MSEKIYELREYIGYFSKRYGKCVVVDIGYLSDGATSAPDLKGKIKCLRKGKPFLASMFWWVHDKLCDTGEWEDGTKCTNWQIAMVAKDILKEEGHWVRDFWWFLAMFAFGGGEARKNGMFYITKLKTGETK